ncbi:flagellar FliJ protein [Nitrosomonas sp. PY1]|uniref:flagellar export protein FliJ n=1 Tax=Nitrosomonas sp. PY1 TaxID=1803906 RepID=UPI001FC847C3|nr:flagellar export protein FliJ [Nitrosomonas sp. PY1]GKS68051.1 flagellar FliJ protein [Nitrosomonas sp. PY1]
MPRSSLHTIVTLTQQRLDSAVKKLSIFNSYLQAEEKKLALLEGYRNNYQIYLHNSMKQGIAHTQWHNFTTFMQKLDSAIDEQRQTVKLAENNRNAGRDEFQTYQRKLKSFEALLKRQQQAEAQQQVKIEQKLMDEFATSNFIRNTMNSMDQ